MQKRFWNWEDEDSTFDLSRQNIGLIDAGLYRGFDSTLPAFGASDSTIRDTNAPSMSTETLTPTMVLTLQHTTTGAVRTQIDRSPSDFFGIIVTKQGVIIHEEDTINLEIEPTGASARIDLIVCEHEYKEITGGLDAVYKVIKGNQPAVAPELTNPSLQVVIGTLRLPANCTSLLSSGVTYTRAVAPAFAGQDIYVTRKNGYLEGDLDGRNYRYTNMATPVAGQDGANKNYVDNKFNSIKPASESERGIIELATQEETNQGTDDVRAVTPKKLEQKLVGRTANQSEVNSGETNKFVTSSTLHQRTATEARRGLARIATEQEVADGSDDSTIVTPYKLKKFIGQDQHVIEIGAWNLSTGSKTIPHSYDWWDKVSGITGAIFGDNGNSYDLASFGINVIANESDFILNAETSTGATSVVIPNRGHIIFFVKSDIIPPDPALSVNAGVDQNVERILLTNNAPVLSKVANTGVDIEIYPTIPEGYDMNQITLQYKKASESIWKDIVSPPLGSPFELEDGVTADNTLYDLRIKVRMYGADYITSRVVQIALNGSNIATDTAIGETIYTELNLEGFVDILGASLETTTWSIVSAPSGGASSVFGNASALSTTFRPLAFGTYVLKLRATGSSNLVAEDMLTINVIQKVNSKPVAVARFSDNTSTKTIAWQTYDPVTGQWYGYYTQTLSATSSTDNDGTIIGHHWQMKVNDGEWGDLYSGANTFPVHSMPSKLIQIDGTWKFRLRVKDNFGSVSEWSNEITLNITGAENNSQPLSRFTYSTTSGGVGSFFSAGILSILGGIRIRSMYIEILQYQNQGGATQPTISEILITGSNEGATENRVRAYLGFNQQLDLYPLVAGDLNTISLNVDIRNTPPNKYVVFRIVAKDSNGTTIGTQTFDVGKLY